MIAAFFSNSAIIQFTEYSITKRLNYFHLYNSEFNADGDYVVTRRGFQRAGRKLSIEAYLDKSDFETLKSIMQSVDDHNFICDEGMFVGIITDLQYGEPVSIAFTVIDIYSLNSDDNTDPADEDIPDDLPDVPDNPLEQTTVDGDASGVRNVNCSLKVAATVGYYYGIYQVSGEISYQSDTTPAGGINIPGVFSGNASYIGYTKDANGTVYNLGFSKDVVGFVSTGYTVDDYCKSVSLDSNGYYSASLVSPVVMLPFDSVSALGVSFVIGEISHSSSDINKSSTLREIEPVSLAELVPFAVCPGCTSGSAFDAANSVMNADCINWATLFKPTSVTEANLKINMLNDIKNNAAQAFGEASRLNDFDMLADAVAYYQAELGAL